LGSGIANGVLGAKESARQAAARRRMRNENRLWYDRRYNEEGRETAVGQRMRERMLEANRARQASARGKGAVMGGTTALQAAESAESGKAMGDLLGRLDANQEARRDRIEGQYRQREAQLDNMDLNASAQHQAQLANAFSTASAVASQIGGAVDGARGGGQKVDASGESAASGGTTASQVGWKAPKLTIVKPGTKVVTAPDPYKEREDWADEYFNRMKSIM
jgi:hypothetical protein